MRSDKVILLNVILISGADGKLSGVSTQAKPGGTLDVLSQPYRNGQVGVATVGDIEAVGW